MSVVLSVSKVCGKTAQWIQMLFGMVSQVGQVAGVLDGVVIIEGEGADLVLNLECPIVTNGELVTRLFPNYFGQYLL